MKNENQDMLQALQNIRLIISEAPTLRIGQVIGNILPPAFNGDAYYLSDVDLKNLTYKYLTRLVKERNEVKR